jgi:hypothetical protein
MKWVLVFFVFTDLPGPVVGFEKFATKAGCLEAAQWLDRKSPQGGELHKHAVTAKCIRDDGGDQ